MTTSEKFRKAAELIGSGEKAYCCYAICEVGLPSVLLKLIYTQKHREDYFENTNGSGIDCDPDSAWFGDPDIPENQTARILALLFAAEFYEE